MLQHYISLIVYKAQADLLAEARRGYLGMLWWIVEPVLYMAAFYVVFVVVFKRGGDHAIAFLLIGLIVWKWFGSAVPMCANALVANKGLIRQVYLPKWVLPLMVIATQSVKFFTVFALLLLFLALTGIPLSVHVLALLPVMIVQCCLILAVGSILAAITPFLPDLKLVVENGMLLLFFVSGIFFDVSSVPEDVRGYLYLNPMLGVIDSYRDILLADAWPDWGLLTIILACSLAGMAMGFVLLRYFDRTYAKVL